MSKSAPTVTRSIWSATTASRTRTDLARRAALLVCALCAIVSVAAAGGERVRVVATTPVILDIVRQVGGDRVDADCLIPPGADPHGFEPRPDDVKRLAAADVIVVNGLGLELWFDRLADSARPAGDVVVASKGVDALTGECEAGHDHDHEGHDHGPADPHAWMNPRNAMIYAINVREALIHRDPAGEADYRAWTDLYLAQLRALDAWIRQSISAIPSERRWLVTDHAAFEYFAAAYGFQTESVAGLSTREEISARGLGDLVVALKSGEVRALFREFGSRVRTFDQLASESGLPVGGELFVDAVGDHSSGADTYIGMMRLNARTIVRALGD